MGWFILVAAMVALSLLAWRRSRRIRRSGHESGFMSPEELGTHVYGSFVTGRDARHRRP